MTHAARVTAYVCMCAPPPRRHYNYVSDLVNYTAAAAAAAVYPDDSQKLRVATQPGRTGFSFSRTSPVSEVEKVNIPRTVRQNPLTAPRSPPVVRVAVVTVRKKSHTFPLLRGVSAAR